MSDTPFLQKLIWRQICPAMASLVLQCNFKIVNVSQQRCPCICFHNVAIIAIYIQFTNVTFCFYILLFWMSLGVCNHLNWPFDNGILKNVLLHLTFPFSHYAVFLMFKFLVVRDLRSETKGSQFESGC